MKMQNKVWHNSIGFEPLTQRGDQDYELKHKEYFDKVHSMKPEKANKDAYLRFYNKFYKEECGVGHLITEEHYLQEIKKDPTLKSFIRDLISWYFLDNKELENIGGFIVCSEPGVGKTTILKALYKTSYSFSSFKVLSKGKFTYLNFNTEINKFKRKQILDLTFFAEDNLVIDDLNLDLLRLKSYGNEFSIDAIIKERYDLWKNKGYWTIITTNYPANLNGQHDELIKQSNTFDLKSLIDIKTLSRAKEQYKEIILHGTSKRLSQ